MSGYAKFNFGQTVFIIYEFPAVDKLSYIVSKSFPTNDKRITMFKVV